MSFTQEFDEHSAWRQAHAAQLTALADWLEARELLDAGARERLDQLREQLRSDKVMVAFVAEFSRGKSELINAVFFAGYGRRIMPASAGRTTMCPTELGFDAEVPPCLRLLPIETRLQPQSLLEWRSAPEQWERIDLDVNDPEQLARAIEKVAEVRHVSQDEARALGFWHDDAPEDNPLPGPDGLLEVPRWRHALINMAHPLLKQGLVILDTPGLNAIGAEPELTVSLLPQAHAVVFILAADAGVSKSDLAMWREHLAPAAERRDSRLVVLNKIDTLWDELSTPAYIEAQIQRQREDSAQVLGLQPQQVIAVSAQKGLLAKVRQDAVLLRESRLADLETALADDVLAQRRTILAANVAASLQALRNEVGQQLHARTRELVEQVQELEALRGKNGTVIRQMRLRIEQEQAEFDASGARIQAVRSVHLKLLKEVFALLGSNHLKAEMAQFAAALKQPGIKLGVKRVYTEAFDRLRAGLRRAQQQAQEVQDMLGGTFRDLNAEFGFALQLPDPMRLARYAEELDLIERNHLQYLGLTNVFRLAQPEFAERLAKAVVSRLKTVYEAASNEVELWNKSAAAQLDGQLRERRKNFARRIEAVHRIQQAAGGLDERLGELQQRLERLAQERDTLLDLTELEEAAAPYPAAEVPGAATAADAAAASAVGVGEGGNGEAASTLTVPGVADASPHATPAVAADACNAPTHAG
ncbi:dynamin family protein [Aquabacterium sp. A08]|uniref:dynamin family protein n=1 Tax=Aquabacterium sp. A08 TaxID=2718532 RepID=UPI001422C3BE|nr:dynamin family protein [Aquabacterium sp. A08]NIC42163.1 dynamin family protein [Aquabacterium sp. A08]